MTAAILSFAWATSNHQLSSSETTIHAFYDIQQFESTFPLSQYHFAYEPANSSGGGGFTQEMKEKTGASFAYDTQFEPNDDTTGDDVGALMISEGKLSAARQAEEEGTYRSLSKIRPPPFFATSFCKGSFITRKYAHPISSNRKALE